MAKIPTIEHRFYYSASPRAVFAALTDPKQLTKWFVGKAVVGLREGGPYRLAWTGGYSMRGRVLAVEAPRKLRIEWNDRFPGKKVRTTEARFTVEKRGRGTLLTVSHRGFRSGKSWIALYGGVESGWAYYLTNLRAYLEHGIDLRSELDQLG